jgi:hypothetical protein
MAWQISIPGEHQKHHSALNLPSSLLLLQKALCDAIEMLFLTRGSHA